MLQIQDRSPQSRPVASLNQSQMHSDATGLNCGNRSWICNTPQVSPLLTRCSTASHFVRQSGSSLVFTCGFMVTASHCRLLQNYWWIDLSLSKAYMLSYCTT